MDVNSKTKQFKTLLKTKRVPKYFSQNFLFLRRSLYIKLVNLMLLCTEVRLKTAGTLFGSVWRKKKNLYLRFIVKSCMHLCSLLSNSFTLSWFLVSLIYLYKVPEIEPSRCHSFSPPYFEFLLKSHGPIIPCVHARLAEGQHGHSGIKFKFQLVLQAVCKAKGHYYLKEAKEPE